MTGNDADAAGIGKEVASDVMQNSTTWLVVTMLVTLIGIFLHFTRHFAVRQFIFLRKGAQFNTEKILYCDINVNAFLKH